MLDAVIALETGGLLASSELLIIRRITSHDLTGLQWSNEPQEWWGGFQHLLDGEGFPASGKLFIVRRIIGHGLSGLQW